MPGSSALAYDVAIMPSAAAFKPGAGERRRNRCLDFAADAPARQPMPATIMA